MRKDSQCGKEKYRRRSRTTPPVVEEKRSLVAEDPEEELQDDGEIEDEEETVDDESAGFIFGADRGSSDDDYEPDVYEEDLDEMDEQERRKKAANEERRRIRLENKTTNYVNPEEMETRIAEFYETGEMSVELAMDIRKICERLSNSSRFVNYTYRDEMAADAFLSAYKAINNRKYKVGCGFNPFSYVTQVAFHSMVQRIKTEQKEREKTDSYREIRYYDAMRDMMGGDEQSESIEQDWDSGS